MRVLVAGWFSFADMGATAGDLLAKEVVCQWLEQAGRTYDVALAFPFHGGVDWTVASPADYSDVVFVCGPFGNGRPIPEFLARFGGRRLIGVNLSMLEPLDVWNPFDLLFERDSPTSARPELTFLSRGARVPVVGLVLVHSQLEYPTGMHTRAEELFRNLTESRTMALVRIDTRLDVNRTGLRTPAEVESLIARMDVVLTTRLHGLVLALKNGVPAIAVDPIGGGAKVRRQAEAIGWPLAFTVDSVDDHTIATAFEFCLTDQARAKAKECGGSAATALLRTQHEFIAALTRVG